MVGDVVRTRIDRLGQIYFPIRFAERSPNRTIVLSRRWNHNPELMTPQTREYMKGHALGQSLVT